tara:strand:- start:696 stop:1136 length:441 start_codon:yes stop_codon:yes gene_type:complete
MKLDFCVLCGTTENLHHHHVIPKVQGGTDNEDNFITLCPKHHEMIHKIRHVDDWFELARLGRERARRAGVKFGMKPKYEHLYDEITKLYLDWNGYGTIGKKLGISSSTVKGIIKDQLKIIGKRGPKPIVYKKDKAGQYKLPILGLG